MIDSIDAEPTTTSQMLLAILRDADGREMSALALRHATRARYGVRLARNTIYMALQRMAARNEVAPLENANGPRTFIAVPAPGEL